MTNRSDYGPPKEGFFIGGIDLTEIEINELKTEIEKLQEENRRLKSVDDSQNEQIAIILGRIDRLQIHLDNGWRKDLIDMLLKMQWKIILIVGSLTGGIVGVLTLLANKI